MESRKILSMTISRILGPVGSGKNPLGSSFWAAVMVSPVIFGMLALIQLLSLGRTGVWGRTGVQIAMAQGQPREKMETKINDFLQQMSTSKKTLFSFFRHLDIRNLEKKVHPKYVYVLISWQKCY